jgi:hypothetical protein
MRGMPSQDWDAQYGEGMVVDTGTDLQLAAPQPTGGENAKIHVLRGRSRCCLRLVFGARSI